ncbi:hypothetical protein DKX38_001705 [Salix brachista]|uniref:Uncharacterized protein n=1 Tax=Salix brachista TaxID=2182728 RepID=A0A5N5P6W7_9ROSI|nr:hypothetical protein DKX38_001705 [Salix brachista]
MVLQDRHESLFIGDIVEEVGKKLDSTALLAPFIAWHRYRLLMKKTKMILHILYLTGVFIFVGLFLYKWIGLWMYLQSGVDEHMASDHSMSFNGKGFGLRGAGADSHRTWTNLMIDGKEIKSAEMLKDSGIGSGTLRSLGIEIPSAGTQKNIDIGIKVICSLVLAFCLS